MCLYSRIGINPKYKSNKKNEGRIPPLNDYRAAFVPWGCGKCMECRKQKSREWNVRLKEDIKTNTNGRFVTLTLSSEKYAELDQQIDTVPYKPYEGYERDNQIITKAIRGFTERWRKKYKKAPRHWLVSELGHKGTENIHMHGIIWVDEIIHKIKIKGQKKKEIKRINGKNKWAAIQEIRDIWRDGFIYPRSERESNANWVNDQTINYSVKYIHKTDKQHKTYKSIILTSDGIGANYKGINNKYKGIETDETYTTKTGHKIAMPKYWRNKIYTEEERELLWMQKLDRQERYVNGIKIDISKNEIEYYKVLKQERKRNKELGYGDDSKNWKLKEYEKYRREIVNMTRIRKIQ